MKIFAICTFLIFVQNIKCQTVEAFELGIDGFLGASNLSGSFGVGPKFGFRLNENLVIGPSFRLQRSWANSLGQKFAYSIYGGGAFLHARYKNVVYGALEFEMLKSPISFITTNDPKKWVPSFFIGGGFSKEFNRIIRLNLGIYYDVINHVNSPFRQGYFVKTTSPQTGQTVKYLPIIYRISFFFNLTPNRMNNGNKEALEEETIDTYEQDTEQ